jgi:hypothetical protein
MNTPLFWCIPVNSFVSCNLVIVYCIFYFKNNQRLSPFACPATAESRGDIRIRLRRTGEFEFQKEKSEGRGV